MSTLDTLVLIFCLPSAILLLCKVIYDVNKGKSAKEIFFPKNEHKS